MDLSQLQSYIRVYENALPAPLCDAMVKKFERDTENQSERKEGHKAFTLLNLTEAPSWKKAENTLLDITRNYMKRYEKECNAYFPERYDWESYRAKRYLIDQDQRFEHHVDCFDKNSAKRFLVLFWYLNDVAEGGETAFPNLGVNVKPVKGRLLMFPPYWMYMHEGRRPISEPKYIIGTYLTYV